MSVRAKGPEASRLRQRKFSLLRQLKVPADALPGSLSCSRLKCGKPTCHCAKGGEGHLRWMLTYMAEGRKHVEVIPAKWVEEARRRVEAGRGFKTALAEMLVANARLFALKRREKVRQ